jgi:hypothetical protein
MMARLRGWWGNPWVLDPDFGTIAIFRRYPVVYII